MALEGSSGVVDTTPVGGAASGSAGSTSSIAPSTGSTGATGSGTPTPTPKWEDDPRAKGILADLQKERKARQDFERQVTEANTRVAERDRQVAALTNTRQPTTEEADEGLVRERLNKLFPILGDLTAEDVKAFRELKTQSSQLKDTIRHHWTEFDKRIMDSVFEKIQGELGDLTDRQKQMINALYVDAAEADPEFFKRHNAGDKTVIDEFVKSYVDNFVEPVRRKATASELSRQRVVPNSNVRTLPAVGGKPIDVTDNKAVMDLLMESRRGKFAR